MSVYSPDRSTSGIFFRAAVGLWSVLLGLAAWASLSWPMIHDAAILHYSAWLIGRGVVPYRDLLEMNLPLTWQVHLLIQWVGGVSDRSARVADLLVLAGMLWLVSQLLKPAGERVRWVGVLLLGTTFLAAGPLAALQRDWLLCLPLLGAGVVALRAVSGWNFYLAGGLLALSACIKPQTLLLGPALVWVSPLASRGAPRRPASEGVAGLLELTRRDILGALILLQLGIVTVVLLQGLLLWKLGALEAFLKLWSGYLSPYYARLSGEGLELEGGTGLYLRSSWAALQHLFSLGAGVPCLLGLAGAGEGLLAARVQENGADDGLRRLKWLLWLLLGYGLLHVVIGVKQWGYHWWPWQVALVASLALLWRPGNETPAGSWLKSLLQGVGALYCAALVLTALLAPQGLEEALQRRCQVEALARTLEHLSEPGDTLLGLDTAQGVSHAALLAQRMPSSRFIYDFHFFHHMERPEILDLRRELLDALDRRPPRLVIVWRTSWAHRTSYEALRLFPELVTRLETRFARVLETDHYQVYRLLQ